MEKIWGTQNIVKNLSRFEAWKRKCRKGLHGGWIHACNRPWMGGMKESEYRDQGLGGVKIQTQI